MPEDTNKTPNFLELLQGLLDDHLGKAAFIEHFTKVIEHVKETDTKFASNFQALSDALSQANTDKHGVLSTNFDTLKEEIHGAVAAALKDIETAKQSVDEKLATVKNGDNADPEHVIAEVLARIQLPEQKEALLDTPEDIRNKLELLLGDERLDSSAIKGLDEAIKKGQPKNAGTVYAGVAHYMYQLQDVDVSGITIGQSLKWDGTRWIPFTPAGGASTSVYGETPSDSGDHTNFTLAHSPIAGTFRLYRGGARQKATDDYTQTTTALVLIVPLETGELLQADYEY